MNEGKNVPPSRPYEPPTVQVLSEADVLKSFQVTSAAGSWWGM